MNKTAWLIVAAIEVVAMVFIVAWSTVMGGCSTQLETTSGGSCYMKCYWTFKAMPFVGIIGVVGALLGCNAKTKDYRRGTAVVCIIAAIVAIVLTTSGGIGLCANAEMHCHTTALGVWIAGAIAIILGLVQFAKADPELAERPKMKL